MLSFIRRSNLLYQFKPTSPTLDTNMPEQRTRNPNVTYQPYEKEFKEFAIQHSLTVKKIGRRYLEKDLTPNTTEILLNQFLNVKEERARMSMTTSLLHHIRLNNLWGNLIREPHFVCLIKLGAQSQNDVFIINTVKWANTTGCMTSNVWSTLNDYIKTLNLDEQLIFKKKLIAEGINF